MAISLFIVGDIVPKSIPAKSFSCKGKQIFKEVCPFIQNADFSIANLEAPVVSRGLTPIRKSGPCLSTSPSTIEVLKEVGFDAVTLANNHFYDQGQQGVNCTIDCCNLQGIKIVGGGRSLDMARKPLIINNNGKQIAIINACENDFSIANAEHGGSNPLDLINMQEDIVAVRKEVDYVVLILHGGIEMYHYPTPRMKRWFHHFIDLGADAVINHHQHCINGFEEYKGKPIFYGLGNFFFPGGSSCPESWNYGYAIRLNLAVRITSEVIPYKQTEKAITLREKEDFNKEIELLNLPIADDFLLQEKFDEYVIDIEKKLKAQLLPSFMRGRIISALARHGYLGRLYKDNCNYFIKNKLICESQYDTLRQLFSILTK